MIQLLHDYLVMFGMVNAVGNLPIFAELTQDMRPEQRSRIFLQGVLTAASIVVCFALFGNWMLRHVFEVSTPALKIAGGIMVFLVAMNSRLRGGVSAGPIQEQYENMAVYPIGFPFLAGPGTIVTTIMLFQSGGGWLTLLAVVLVYATLVPLLHLAPHVERAVGRVGILVATRILSLFIAAKAVSFTIDGIKAAFGIA
jgi:multiple antibiotic resistance protein